MLALVFSAFAVPAMDTAGAGDAAPCTSSFGRTMPEDGAVGVPLDAGLAVEIVEPACAWGDFTLSLYKGDDTAPIQESTGDGRIGIVELVPDRELDPNTDYTLSALEASGYLEPEIITFTTGESPSAAAAWEVTMDSLTASWNPDNHLLAVVARAGIPLGQPDFTWARGGPVADASDTNPEVQSAAYGFGGGTVGLAWQSFPDTLPDEACGAVQGRNVDGSWTDGVAQCVEVALVDSNGLADTEDGADCGCSTGTTPGMAGSAVLFGVAFLTRRRW